MRGTVRVSPEMIGTTAFALDPAGRHRWHPVAPRARVEVEMTHPGVRWSGDGYFDSNFGDEPLEDGFDDWHWSRAHLKNDVAVLYEGRRRDGTPFDLALKFDRQGRWHDVVQPAAAPSCRAPAGWSSARRAPMRVTRRGSLKTWIDAPFYARTALATRLFGEDVPRGPRKPVARPLPLTDRPVDAPLPDAARLLVTFGVARFAPCPSRSRG